MKILLSACFLAVPVMQFRNAPDDRGGGGTIEEQLAEARPALTVAQRQVTALTGERDLANRNLMLSQAKGGREKNLECYTAPLHRPLDPRSLFELVTKLQLVDAPARKLQLSSRAPFPAP